jgi:hypothetical protein
MPYLGMSQISELDFLKILDDSLDQLAPDARARVLTWANAKYGATTVNGPIGMRSSAVLSPHARPTEIPTDTSKVKRGRPKKSILKIVKDLSLNPSGKHSFRDFVNTKHPANLLEKCAVAVYYLSNVLELPEISVDHVFTAFKGAEWRLPNDLANTLQQAGTKGWLDTRKSTDLKVTPIGENLVEHDLSPVPQAATV